MSKKSLSEKFIHLVSKADLDNLKIWVEQTNLNNLSYILESLEIAKKENRTHFYYWEVGSWTIEIAGENGDLEMIDYIMLSEDFKNKPDICESDTNPILTQSKNSVTFAHLVKSGSLKNISYALKNKFEWQKAQTIIFNLSHFFLDENTEKLNYFLNALLPLEDENDESLINFCKQCFEYAQNVVQKKKMFNKLNMELSYIGDIDKVNKSEKI